MTRMARVKGTAIACLLVAGLVPAAGLADEVKQAEAAAAAVAPVMASPIYPSLPQVHIGNARKFRSPIPAAVLERQATAEYRQLLTAATVQKTLLPGSDPRVRRLRAIAHRLIPAAYKWNEQAKRWQWEINIVHSPRIDAFVLPGGKILFYSGMFDRLRLTDNETAMLLGHEIAHALREHAREYLDKEETAQAGTHGELAQLFGLNSPVNQPLGLITQMLMLKYSGSDETEADIIGTDIAARAGYDPRAAIELWHRLLKWNRITPVEFLASHPMSVSRIHDLQGRLPEMLELYAKARQRAGKQPAHG